MPIVFFQERVSKAPIGIPIPDITPLNPPLGLVPPLPPKIEQLTDTAQLSAAEALMAGLAYAGQQQRLGVRQRPARRGALRPPAASRASSSACAAPACRSTGCTTSRA